MMNKLGLILFLITNFITFKLAGQSELEIKTTGKYIYSWAIENDKQTALETAKSGLLDTIFVSLLKESAIDKTDTIFIKVINYFEQQVGLKWQAIAFAEKSNIKFKLEQRKQLKVIPVIIGDPSDQNQNTHPAASVNENSIPESKGLNNGTSENNNSHIKTGDLILDDLLTLSDAKVLEQKLKKLQTGLKLNYGNKQNYPDDSDCYIFVIDRNTNRILAVYDKGNTTRKNLLTNTSDNNYADKYKGYNFLYVVIN